MNSVPCENGYKKNGSFSNSWVPIVKRITMQVDPTFQK